MQRINHDQNLNSTDSVQHMRVVARRGPEPSALMLTREHEVNRLVPRERFRVTEQV